jgi:hypothetical protein
VARILKSKMLKKLHDTFPQIIRISKFGSPPKLGIFCHHPILDNRMRQTQILKFTVWIDCFRPGNYAEPYTNETLEKAIEEFPDKYEQKFNDISKK